MVAAEWRRSKCVYPEIMEMLQGRVKKITYKFPLASTRTFRARSSTITLQYINLEFASYQEKLFKEKKQKVCT